MKNSRRLVFAWVVINSFISVTTYAQSIDDIYNKFIKGYHTYQSTTLPYYIFKPASYNTQIHYPLVLCLHGSGERGDNPSAVKNNTMATVWARDSNQTHWPCFIFVPQCPSSGWWTDLNIILTVNDILDSLLLESCIDTNRLYITGLSMGGYGTWSMIAYYPNKFAAAVPMSGGGDPSTASLIKHIPIWDFHGAKDGTVNVAYSRAMITALENAGDTVIYTNCHNGDCIGLSDSVIAEKIKNGAKLLYTEYENGGHSIWDQAYNTVFLLPWVFAQSKSQIPTGIERENFNSLPKGLNLSQNYPNPFNPTTTISFSLPCKSFVSLKIFDLIGREIKTIVNEEKLAGEYEIEFNAGNLSSGVYFYRLQTGNYIQTKKLLLLK